MEQVNIRGVIAVIDVQLYLFTYLRQLSGKLQPSDPGWDVPWIGIDSSFLATAMFFTSLVVLPPGTLASLGYVALLHAHQSGNPLLKRTTTGWVVAILLSLILAIVSWRVRPKLAPVDDSDELPAKD